MLWPADPGALCSKDKLIVQLSKYWRKKNGIRIIKGNCLYSWQFCADSRVRQQENSTKCQAGSSLVKQKYGWSDAKYKMPTVQFANKVFCLICFLNWPNLDKYYLFKSVESVASSRNSFIK